MCLEGEIAKTKAFRAYSPHGLKLRGPPAEHVQLGVEFLFMKGTLKVSPHIDHTNVNGVFAAEDFTSVAHNFTTATQAGVDARFGALLRIQSQALDFLWNLSDS